MEFRMDPNKYQFVTQKRMPSGMTARVTFIGSHWDNQRTAFFNIWLVVYKKRKQIKDLTLHETGRDGISTLLFAKQAILEFEKYILKEYGDCHHKMFIGVGWDDNRRRNIYHRGLKSEGYHFEHFEGQRYLLKQIM